MQTLNHQDAAELFVRQSLQPALAELGIRAYKLNNANEIKVQNGQAVRVPATPPYVVYDARPQSDKWSKMGVAYAQFDVTIRAVVRGYDRDTVAPNAAIDRSLRSAAGEVEGVRVTCKRTSTFNNIYPLEGDNMLTHEKGIRCQVRVWEG